jgi:hypothetical protein
VCADRFSCFFAPNDRARSGEDVAALLRWCAWRSATAIAGRVCGLQIRERVIDLQTTGAEPRDRNHMINVDLLAGEEAAAADPAPHRRREDACPVALIFG